jgi:hypothetical protein
LSKINAVFVRWDLRGCKGSDMRRREFITLVGALGGTVALPFATRALESERQLRRIGVLWPGTTPPMPPRMESFRQGLGDAGMIEGRDFLIEVRYARNGL